MKLNAENVRIDIKVKANENSKRVKEHYKDYPELIFSYGIVRNIERDVIVIDLYNSIGKIIRRNVKWSIPHAYTEKWFIILKQEPYSIDNIEKDLEKLERRLS